ncbi:hypothetical protein AOQ84DRAFT_402391 [Glonium stellatum]|uniref:Uncharacterized protein n=1 Tax=Glonium stellatum TaxID=574774 RepID=A0A8E2JLC7_9PEZI|nr:hypothetical protein AOQ84DRAFT_402391 [Glonium stellatum]
MFPGYAPPNRTSYNRKRDRTSSIGYIFEESTGDFCAPGDLRCWNFFVDKYGGFCCEDTGRCCDIIVDMPIRWCPNFSPALARHNVDGTSRTTSVCCPSGSSCVEPSTTIIAYETTVVTAEYTTIEIHTQSISAALSISIQTQLVTKTNSASRTFITTATTSGEAAAAVASSPPSATFSNSHTAAIIDRVVGVMVFLALLPAFLFIGTRKSWFHRRPKIYAGYRRPGIAAEMAGEPKPHSYPEMASSNNRSLVELSHGGVVSSTQTYQSHHMLLQYAREMDAGS